MPEALPARPTGAAPALRLQCIGEMPPKMEPSDGHREQDAQKDGCDQAGQGQSQVKRDAASQGEACSAQPAQELDSGGAHGQSK